MQLFELLRQGWTGTLIQDQHPMHPNQFPAQESSR